MSPSSWVCAGNVASADAILQKSESVKPTFPWEPPQIERAKTAVRKQNLGSAATPFRAVPRRRTALTLGQTSATPEADIRGLMFPKVSF